MVLSNVGVIRVEPLPLWPTEEEDVIWAARSSGQLIEEVSMIRWAMVVELRVVNSFSLYPS